MVSRRPDPSDGRAALLSLTSAGEMVVESRRADRVAKLARLIDQLDDRDRAVLADAQGVLSRLVATVIEDFNTVFLRLASVQRLNFSTLSVLHTLSRGGPMRLTDLLATEQIKQPP